MVLRINDGTCRKEARKMATSMRPGGLCQNNSYMDVRLLSLGSQVRVLQGAPTGGFAVEGILSGSHIALQRGSPRNDRVVPHARRVAGAGSDFARRGLDLGRPTPNLSINLARECSLTALRP